MKESLEAEPVAAMKLIQRAMVPHDVSMVNLSRIRGQARETSLFVIPGFALSPREEAHEHTLRLRSSMSREDMMIIKRRNGGVGKVKCKIATESQV